MHNHFGYSHDEIDEASRGIKKVRKQRNKSKVIKSGGMKEKAQEAGQMVMKGLKRTFSLPLSVESDRGAETLNIINVR